MRIPDKIYNVLKWVLIIVVPAFEVLLNSLAKAWGWDIPLEAINITISSIATFIGICVGISSANYKKENQ